MIIGKMNKRIIIQSPTTTPDGQGGRKNDFTTKYTVWASIEPPTATTAVIQGAVSSEMTHAITIRKIDEQMAGYKVLHGAREYEILHSYENMYNGTVLQCREIVKRV